MQLIKHRGFGQSAEHHHFNVNASNVCTAYRGNQPGKNTPTAVYCKRLTHIALQRTLCSNNSRRPLNVILMFDLWSGCVPTEDNPGELTKSSWWTLLVSLYMSFMNIWQGIMKVKKNERTIILTDTALYKTDPQLCILSKICKEINHKEDPNSSQGHIVVIE